MLFFSFSAGILIDISFLLCAEWLISAISNSSNTSAAEKNHIILVSFVFVIILICSCLIMAFAWNPKRIWRFKLACHLILLASILSIVPYSISIGNAEYQVQLFGLLTMVGGFFAFLSYLLHLMVDNFLINRYFGPENDLNIPSFVPSSTGITYCQLQLLILGTISCWFLSISALLFFWLESGDHYISYERWIHFCIASLTTIGSADITLKSPSSQIIFPLFSIIGLLLFGMILVVIRRAILEWITLRVSNRVYATLLTWASGRDMGLELNTPEQIWKSINPPPLHDLPSNEVVGTGSSSSSPLQIPSKKQSQNSPLLASLPIFAAINEEESETENNNGTTTWETSMSRPLFVPRTPGSLLDTSKPTFIPHVASIFNVDTTSPLVNTGTATPTSAPHQKHHRHRSATALTIPSLRRIQTVMRSPTISSISINTPLVHPAGGQSPSPAVDPIRLYKLLQSTLLWQLLIAFILNILYFLLFSFAIYSTERWHLVKCFVFAFNSITTMGSPYSLKSVEGRLVFIGAIIVAMGLLMYLGSVVAELISNQWRIHVETVEEEYDEDLEISH